MSPQANYGRDGAWQGPAYPIEQLQAQARALSEDQFLDLFPCPVMAVAPGRSPHAEPAPTPAPASALGAGETRSVQRTDLDAWLTRTSEELVPPELGSLQPADPGTERLNKRAFTPNLSSEGISHALFVKKSGNQQNPFSHMISIGRLLHNDVVLPYSPISKVHAVLLSTPPARWWVMDQNSTNGTWIGSSQLRAGEKRALKDGDWLSLGHTLGLRFFLPPTFYRFLRDEL